jgi:hypothetical protein
VAPPVSVACGGPHGQETIFITLELHPVLLFVAPAWGFVVGCSQVAPDDCFHLDGAGTTNTTLVNHKRIHQPASHQHRVGVRRNARIGACMVIQLDQAGAYTLTRAGLQV